ncbi:MAG TPA: restriction endonuclease subunit S [bacterium]|nr:restriction endonuclease subunit S [bacterium]
MENKMTDWKECKLGEVAEVVGGGTPSTSVNEFWNGNISWLTPRDLTGYSKMFISRGERNITQKGLENSSAKLMPKGTVLLTSRAPIGYVAIAENEICTNQGFKNLVLNNEIAFNKFLYYWIKNNQEYLQSIGTGTTFAEISGSVVKNIDILLPPLPEQKAIASVLSSLDDKIDLLHRQNKTLEAMAETLFKQWFVETTNTVKIADIIEIHDSKRVPLSSTERDKMKNGELFPYYGAATIMDYINQYIFDEEHLLLGEDGTVQTEDGYPILQIATGKYWVNNHTHVLNAKKPFTNFLLYTILKKTSISHIVTGAVQPKINQENLKSLEIEVPDLFHIEEVAKSTDIIWNKIKNNYKQIRTLEKLRDNLLPKLMSGEVRVLNLD